MKIRNGFVTNSSSSSFIIAIKGGLDNLENIVDVEHGKWKTFIVSGIKSALARHDNFDTDEAVQLFSNMKEFDAFVKDEGEWLDAANKKRYAELVGEGFTVYKKSVSYHDHGTREQLKSMRCADIYVEDND